MLIRIAPAAQRKLVAAVAALLCDPLKILDSHVRLLHQHAALVAANARLGAKPGLTVETMTHDPDICLLYTSRCV